MQITIRFDKDRSKCAYENFEFNKVFVKAQCEYIKDLCKYQGYIYLNTIYELLGLKWNPYNENVCWVFERDGELKISITPFDSYGKIRIDIFTNHQERAANNGSFFLS